jgi:hypothetical protein
MNIPQKLTNLIGEWTGTNRLWLTPEDEALESATQAVVALTAQGKFMTIRYSWSYEGEPQDGLVLVGFNQNQQVEKAVWIDSWHMNDQIMVCLGEHNQAGGIVLSGSYPAPPDPDWGWWIEVDPLDGETFKLVMHNVPPNGKAELAVEAVFSKIDGNRGS